MQLFVGCNTVTNFDLTSVASRDGIVRNVRHCMYIQAQSRVIVISLLQLP